MFAQEISNTSDFFIRLVIRAIFYAHLSLAALLSLRSYFFFHNYSVLRDWIHSFSQHIQYQLLLIDNYFFVIPSALLFLLFFSKPNKYKYYLVLIDFAISIIFHRALFY